MDTEKQIYKQGIKRILHQKKLDVSMNPNWEKLYKRIVSIVEETEDHAWKHRCGETQNQEELNG